LGRKDKMQNDIWRKRLFLGIILCFIGAVITPYLLSVEIYPATNQENSVVSGDIRTNEILFYPLGDDVGGDEIGDACDCELPLEAWDNFTATNEKYVYHFSVLWNDETCTPEGVFGPVSLNSYLGNESLNESNIEQVTRDFISDYKELLGVDNISNLVKEWTVHEDNSWFIRYKQYYKGVLVDRGKVSLSIFDENIISFGSLYFPKINISVTPIVNESEAIAIANETVNGIGSETKATLMVHKPNATCLFYKLVWSIDIDDMRVIVDAETGDIVDSYTTAIWQTNILQGYVKGEHTIDGPGASLPEQNDTFPYGQIWLYNNSPPTNLLDITNVDSNGFFRFSWDEPLDFSQKPNKTINDTLISPWVRIVDGDSNVPDGREFLEEKVTLSSNNERKNVTWLNNMAECEVSAYYHVNYLIEYTHLLRLTAIRDGGIQLTVDVDDGSSRSNGPNIWFDSSIQDACSPDVNYHETTHSVQYYENGGGFPPIGLSTESRAILEAFADYFACSINNDDIFNEEDPTPPTNRGDVPRDLSNNWKYDTDFVAPNGAYQNSVIISGAMWDFRQQPNIGRNISDFLMARVMDLDNTGGMPTTFRGFLRELLEEDDFPGNDYNGNNYLADGTPHIHEICTAFYTNHNIPDETCNKTIDAVDSTGFIMEAFHAGDRVYVRGCGFPRNSNVDIHIAKYNDSIDWTSTFPLTILDIVASRTNHPTDANGTISTVDIWDTDMDDIGYYNVLVNIDRNNEYNGSIDTVDNPRSWGFRVHIVNSTNSTGDIKDVFCKYGESIYAEGAGFPNNTRVNIYIVENKDSWQNRDLLAEKSGITETVTTDENGTLNNTKIWDESIIKDVGLYDIVVDVNRNGRYDKGVDAVDNLTTQGFEIPESNWTIMVYMAAETPWQDRFDLDDEAFIDINEMEKIGSDVNVSIVVLVDFDSTQGLKGKDFDDENTTYLFYIKRDDKPDNITSPSYKKWKDLNMGDNGTIEYFVKNATKCFPADNYALILWGSADGWKVNPDDALGLLPDTNPKKDALNMSELRIAMQHIASSDILDKKLDILGYDAPLMGLVSVARQVKEYVDISIASEGVNNKSKGKESPTKEGDGGWNYTMVLDNITNNPDWDPIKFSKEIVKHGEKNDDLDIISAINLSALQPLLNTIDTFALELRGLVPVTCPERGGIDDYDFFYGINTKHIDNVQIHVREHRFTVETYGGIIDLDPEDFAFDLEKRPLGDVLRPLRYTKDDPVWGDMDYMDLYHFAQLIWNDGTIPLPYKASAPVIMDLIKNGPVVLEEYHNDKVYTDNSHGISIYFPYQQARIDENEKTGWDPLREYAYDEPSPYNYSLTTYHETDNFLFPQETLWNGNHSQNPDTHGVLARYYEPVSDAGEDKITWCCHLVFFDGTGSSDSDFKGDFKLGLCARYLWDFGDGAFYTEYWDDKHPLPGDNDGLLDPNEWVAPDGVYDGKTFHHYKDPGVYTVRLYVWDDTDINTVDDNVSMIKWDCDIAYVLVVNKFKDIEGPVYIDQETGDSYVTSETEFSLYDIPSSIPNVYIFNFFRWWFDGVWYPEPGTGVGIGNNYTLYTEPFTFDEECEHHIEYYGEMVIYGDWFIEDGYVFIEDEYETIPTYITSIPYYNIHFVDNSPPVTTPGWDGPYISKPEWYETVVLYENFLDSTYESPPPGWTDYGGWKYPISNYAGGESPEAKLCWTYASGDDWLMSSPVDTTGGDTLELEFKTFIDYYTTGCSFFVEIRPDPDSPWIDITPWPNPITDNVGPDTFAVDASAGIGTETQIRFRFSGYYYDFDYWYIDDIKLTSHVLTEIYWVTSDTLIYLDATEEGPCNSGVKDTYYRVDGGELCMYAGPFSFLQDGEYLIEYFSEDNLGNTEDVKSQIVRVDNTPPITTLEFGEPYYPNESGEWITSRTPVYLNATDYPDYGCGVKEICYNFGYEWINVSDDHVIFYIPGECDHTIQWYAVDELGNTESIKSQDVIVDNKPPITIITTDSAFSQSFIDKINVTINTTFYLYSFDHGPCNAGSRNVYYRIFPSTSSNTPWIICTSGANFTLTELGLYIVEYYSDDYLGNQDIIHRLTIYVYDLPPNAPSNPIPPDGARDVPIDAILSWNCSDPGGDPLTYDVYFGTTSPPLQVVWNQSETVYDPGIMNHDTQYYWKIVAWDNHGGSAEGPIWTFTTERNNPPAAPTINGPSKGKAGEEYEYTFVTTDPEGHDVYYWIEWGDGIVEEDDWIGPYASGEEVTRVHTWDEDGTYMIRTKAKDIFDAESDWGYLEVEMPVNR